MYLDEFGCNVSLNKLLNKLQCRHNTKIDFSDSIKLLELHKHYSLVKTSILAESSYNSYHSNPDYIKAVLVCEAIRLFLSEIAPGRPGKIVRRKGKISEAEIKPEMKDGLDGGDDYWGDAPVKFDGSDFSDDYNDGRKPNTDGSPVIDYDYTDLSSLVDDKFLIEPETGDSQGTEEFSGSDDPDIVGQEVAKRYYDTPGPTPSDYADDRNVESISKMMDGPGFHSDDVIDKIEAMPDSHPGPETKTGLPTELEKGVKPQSKGDRKNGVVDQKFHQDPRQDKQREIPDPNDLQKQNNKMMYGVDKKVKNLTKVEEEIAGQVVLTLNKLSFANKILESVKHVAEKNNKSVRNVLDSYKLFAPFAIIEKVEDENTVYNKAMLYALELINNVSFRDILVSAQGDAKVSERLFQFLINKAKHMGFGDKSRQFAISAHNALINADILAFSKYQSA